MLMLRGKRKFNYNGKIYYWFVRINDSGHRLHIMSADKRINLEFPFVDTEVPITPRAVREQLEDYFKSKNNLMCS